MPGSVGGEAVKTPPDGGSGRKALGHIGNLHQRQWGWGSHRPGVAAAPRSRPAVPGGVPPTLPPYQCCPCPTAACCCPRVSLPSRRPAGPATEAANRKGAEPAVSVCFWFAFIFRPLELLQRGHGPQLSVQEQSPRAGQFQQPARELQGHRPGRGCAVGLSQPRCSARRGSG